MNNPITVTVDAHAPHSVVWQFFNDPAAIVKWNTASDDWHTTHAENNAVTGGTFFFRMEAKDGSEGFDFAGVYDEVIPQERIAYTMGDGRKVEITFIEMEGVTKVVESFEPESENTHDLQRAGWQAILNNFKKYVEEKVNS